MIEKVKFKNKTKLFDALLLSIVFNSKLFVRDSLTLLRP